jgi:DNA-binding transcriptional LysR family regulator
MKGTIRERSSLKFKRRRFVACFASTGLGPTLLPGVLSAMAQDAPKIMAEMVESAALLAGLTFSPEAVKEIVDSLNGRMSPL